MEKIRNVYRFKKLILLCTRITGRMYESLESSVGDSSVFVTCVIRFLSMLEEEIYGENSPIWEADFTMPASDGTQLGHQTGEAGVQSAR